MPDYEKFRILVDIPASHPGLGFDEAASGLAGLIRESEPQFAIAVFGPWGSGKTTMMQAVKKKLQQQKIICIDFSAWRYEKEEHLIVPLLDSIRSGLMLWSRNMQPAEGSTLAPKTRERKEKFARAARNTAQTVGKVIASMLAGFSFKIGIPGALDLSYDANKSLTAAREAGKQKDEPRKSSEENSSFVHRLDDPDLPQSFYHACFTALTETFHQFEVETGGARIVVFVDDLDRCLPSGTLQVLESMKLFFDLRGFVFVVGLDRDVVERSIDSRYSLHNEIQQDSAEPRRQMQRLILGADYLKKIFQVPFSLAPVSLELMDDLFNSMRNSSNLPQLQIEDLEKVVRPHLAYLFAGTRLNPREVKRYINAYTIQMKVKPGLDPNMVLVLNTLGFRQDCANLYDAIATYREEAVMALNSLIKGEIRDFEDLDINAADVPFDIRDYLRPGNVGSILLTAGNIGTYLDAGEATRSSSGGYLLGLLTRYREFRDAVLKAIESNEPVEFDGAWSMAISYYKELLSGMMSIYGEMLPSELTAIEQWLDAGNNATQWQKLLKNMNSGDNEGDTENLRTEAKNEALGYIKTIQLLLREQRRRSFLNS